MSYILFYLCSLSQKRKTKIMLISLIILYTLSGITFETDLTFNLINISLLIILPLITQKIKKYNEFICIFSILIYSILIDIICFYLYPSFNYGVSLLIYIYNGILFNLKGITISTIICLTISLIIYYVRKKYESSINCS